MLLFAILFVLSNETLFTMLTLLFQNHIYRLSRNHRFHEQLYCHQNRISFILMDRKFHSFLLLSLIAKPNTNDILR